MAKQTGEYTEFAMGLEGNMDSLDPYSPFGSNKRCGK